MMVKTAQSDEYETPDWLFQALDAEFGFTFDAAATQANAKCKLFTSDIESGPPQITLPSQVIFCNPPYSKIALFTTIVLGSRAGWLMVLPNFTDRSWYRRLCYSSRVALRPFRRRVRFMLAGVVQGSPRFGTILAIVAPRD